MAEEDTKQEKSQAEDSKEETQKETRADKKVSSQKEEKEEEKKEKAKEEKDTAKESKGQREETKEIEVPKKFQKLVEEIEKMTVSDLAELVKILEDKFGVSAQPAQVVAPVPAGSGATGAGAAPAAEEKSVFNIELQEIGAKKIEVIKVVRDVTGKGLKESKDLVDAAEKEPQMIKENVKKEEAEEIKKKFEAAGAKVELK